jgi:hypothetical protein
MVKNNPYPEMMTSMKSTSRKPKYRVAVMKGYPDLSNFKARAKISCPKIIIPRRTKNKILASVG